MPRIRSISRFFLLLSVLLVSASVQAGGNEDKIAGVSLVGPPRTVDENWTWPVAELGAEWVAIMPYAFCRMGKPEIYYGSDRQWWGEKPEGVRELIRHAHARGLRVMLKPMVWTHEGWIGEFKMDSEKGWKAWEAAYREYFDLIRTIAIEEKVEMLCIGTEYRTAARERAGFWKSLIRETRKMYSGSLTYAANWDNFSRISFWSDLDYVGVDAYFPLADARTPDVKALLQGWKKPLRQLQQVALQSGKRVLFTEFGYRSTDRTAWNQWEQDHLPRDQKVNLKAQRNAYEAFFKATWNQDWFAGLFLWQWYCHHDEAGGDGNSDFTPQNKPAESLIRSYFCKDRP